MYELRIIIPVSFAGKEILPPEVYRVIADSAQQITVGEFTSATQGRGSKIKFQVLGEAQVTFRGPTLIAIAIVQQVPANKPYARLLCKFEKDSSVGVSIALTDEPGELKQTNYTWSEIK